VNSVDNTAHGRPWGSIVIFLALLGLAIWFREPLKVWFGVSKPPAAGSASGSIAKVDDEIDHYTCSMHPSVNQKTPGSCPICGMTLIPVTKKQQAQGEVIIDDARRQLIGVRTSPVTLAPMRRSFKATGKVAYDESSLTDVNLKVQGWISKLFVNESGQKVARGQPLFSLYSPELFNAEQDFLLASKGAMPASATGADTDNHANSFRNAARQRLHLLGLSEDQIIAIESKGAPQENITVPSPASGFVIEKNVVEGSSVDPGMRLYRIAALNKVWIEADIYEADLASVKVGQPAQVTLNYLPDRAYDAKIAYVYPYLDSAARTGRVRIELSNKDLELRPGMYASVELQAEREPALQVPASAVIYTGPRRLVFVDLGNGHLRPQEIHIGIEEGGMYEVRDGLKAGDVVVTSGAFLIAAEARISTAAKYWDSTAGQEAQEMANAMPPAAMPSAAMPAMPKEIAPAETLKPSSNKPKAEIRKPAAAPPLASQVPEPAAAPAATYYTCPMHPQVHSPVPGKCPICGMDLVPKTEGSAP
jgi:Cu(I)/Ag(I) efflux system membrane fusion protein